MDTITSTAISTASALIPTLLMTAGTAGAANPAVSSAMALMPVALQLLTTAQQITSAGMMTQDQLAALFSTIGANIKASHDQWVAAGSPTV